MKKIHKNRNDKLQKYYGNKYEKLIDIKYPDNVFINCAFVFEKIC